MTEKVLVGLGERKRPVSFQSSSDPESLLAAIKTVQDVLNDENEEHMVLLVKSDRWNVELHGDMVVPSNSIVHLSVDAQSSAQEVFLLSSHVKLVMLT